MRALLTTVGYCMRPAQRSATSACTRTGRDSAGRGAQWSEVLLPSTTSARAPEIEPDQKLVLNDYLALPGLPRCGAAQLGGVPRSGF
jgi:hypothetical protein